MIERNLLRMANWSIQKIGVGTLISFTLLLVILGSVVGGITGVIALKAGASLFLMAMLGLFAGWLLGSSALPGWLCGILVAAGGFVSALVYSGQMVTELILLGRVMIRLSWEVLLWRPGVPLPETSLVSLLAHNLALSAAHILSRFNPWFKAILTGAPVYDPLASTFAWFFLFWLVGGWAGWFVRRWDSPVQGILPGAILIAVTLSYTRSEIWVLLPMLGATLILLAWRGFSRQKDHWDSHAIDYAESIHFDLALWTGVLVTSVIGAAALLSYISPQQISQSIRDFSQNRGADGSQIGEAMGLERRPAQDPESLMGRSGSLPREHLIQSGPELSQQLAMIIEPSHLPAADPEINGIVPQPPFYWRALSYDIYTSRGWTTSQTEKKNYQANEHLPVGETPGHIKLAQKVQIVRTNDPTIYAAGELVTVDRSFLVEGRVVEGSGLDILGATLSETEQGLTYSAESILPLFGEAELRSAGEEYPDWIVARYLELPDNVPQRVRQLASEVVEGSLTPYDKAQAIENYLRGYPYTLDVPKPPPGRDVADYFLFSLRKGYCDYYATAMVVMARAADLPARLVIGYAPGRYNVDHTLIVVTEADAHSWVEVYFPGTGWVEFEPTGGLSSIQRLASVPFNSLSRDEPTSQASRGPLDLRPWLSAAAWAGMGAALLALALLGWSLGDSWRLRRLGAQGTLAALYGRLHRYGQRLDISSQPGDTPYEFSRSLQLQIETLAEERKWGKRITPAVEESSQLVNLYTEAIYSQHQPGVHDQQRAVQTWGRLRFRLWLARLLRFSGR